MTLLRHFELLKSLGFEYCNDLHLNKKEIQDDLPNTLDQLEQTVKHCNLCQCSKSRSNVLFGSGDVDAQVVFLGDFNSSFEDQEGNYYKGKVGELLASMIENVLLFPKERFYITNILKCLPQNIYSVPEVDIQTCKGYLLKQLDIINPKIIVTLGEHSFNHLSEQNIQWNKVRGNIIKHKNYTILPMFHPSIILRNPTLKKDAYHDMLKLKSFISENQSD
ncbi:MAG: uracil-DNA glycosylase [Campylobacterota bacterium]|nr:uracil-DNA glycosylase [Campylobacterota bacterium]